mmetsp:Transcript_18265/g.32980  ORF Transcript_18265/g.32980 Transcript_18265/m.32980 type:complete len:144 (-) Transcript_18265:47-478(-)
MFRLLILVAALLQISHGFAPSSPSRTVSISRTSPVKSIASIIESSPLRMADGESEESTTTTPKTTSLEEKMKSWEASEEEIKAATLGGVVPGGGGGGEDRTDAFDVGLYIAFPIMVISCLAFVFFPLIVGNIDINSVGPPPTS